MDHDDFERHSDSQWCDHWSVSHWGKPPGTRLPWTRTRRTPKDTDPNRVVAVFGFHGCDCRIEIRFCDMPVHSMHCEHGHFITPARHDGTITGSILIASNDE